MEVYGNHSDPTLREAGLDAIYVVHYTPYAYRREYMQAALDRLGLAASFVTGWDRENISDADVACMYPTNKFYREVAVKRHYPVSWLLVGELSICMKHAAAYYDAVRRGHRNVLILEDDAVFAEDFKAELAKLLLNRSLSDYDILFLGNYEASDATEAAQAPRVVRDGAPKGAVGYLLSQKGARHLVGNLPISGPPDHVLSNSEYPNAPPLRYSRLPWLIWQGSRDQRWRRANYGTVVYKGELYIRTNDTGSCEGCACPGQFTPLSEHIVRPGGPLSPLSMHRLTGSRGGAGFSAAELGRLASFGLSEDYAAAVVRAGKACSVEDVLRYEGIGPSTNAPGQS